MKSNIIKTRKNTYKIDKNKKQRKNACKMNIQKQHTSREKSK